MNHYPEVMEQAMEEDAGLMTMFLLNEEEFSWTTASRILREFTDGDTGSSASRPRSSTSTWA